MKVPPIPAEYHVSLCKTETYHDIKYRVQCSIDKPLNQVTNHIKNISTILCHDNAEKTSKTIITGYTMMDLTPMADVDYPKTQSPDLEIAVDSLGSPESLSKYYKYDVDKAIDNIVLSTLQNIANVTDHESAMVMLNVIYTAMHSFHCNHPQILTLFEATAEQGSVRCIADHKYYQLLTIISEHAKNHGKTYDFNCIDNKLLEKIILNLLIQEAMYYSKKILIKSANEILTLASLPKMYRDVNPTTTSHMVKNTDQVGNDSAHKTKNLPNLVKIPNLIYETKKILNSIYETKKLSKEIQNITDELNQLNIKIKENLYTIKVQNELEEKLLYRQAALKSLNTHKVKEMDGKKTKKSIKKWPNEGIKEWPNKRAKEWQIETKLAISLDNDTSEINKPLQVNERILTKRVPSLKSPIVRQTDREVPQSLTYIEVIALDMSNDDQSRNLSPCSDYTPSPSPVDHLVEPLKQSEYTPPEKTNCNEVAQSSLPDFTDQTTAPCMEDNLQDIEEEGTDTTAVLEQGNSDTGILLHDDRTEAMNKNKNLTSKTCVISELNLCQALQFHTNFNTCCETAVHLSATTGQNQGAKCLVEVPDRDNQCLVKVIQPCTHMTVNQKCTVHMVCNVQYCQDQQPCCTDITRHLQELEKFSSKILPDKQLSVVSSLQPKATFQTIISTQHHSATDSGSKTNFSGNMYYQLKVQEQLKNSSMVQSTNSSQSNARCSIMIQDTCHIHKTLKDNTQLYHTRKDNACAAAIVSYSVCGPLSDTSDNTTPVGHLDNITDDIDLAATPVDHLDNTTDDIDLVAAPVGHLGDSIDNFGLAATTVDHLNSTTDNIDLVATTVDHLDGTTDNIDLVTTPVAHLDDITDNIDLVGTSDGHLDGTTDDIDVATSVDPFNNTSDNIDLAAPIGYEDDISNYATPAVTILSNAFDNANHPATTSVSVLGLPSNTPNNGMDSFVQDTKQNAEGNIIHKCQESNYPDRIVQLIPFNLEVTGHHNQLLHGKATDHYIMVNDPCAITTGYKGCCAYGSFFQGNKLCPTKILLRFLYVSTKCNPILGLQRCVNCTLQSNQLHREQVMPKNKPKVYWIPQLANCSQSYHIFCYLMPASHHYCHVIPETFTNNSQSPEATSSCDVAKYNKISLVCTSVNVLGNDQHIVKSRTPFLYYELLIKFIRCVLSDSTCTFLTMNTPFAQEEKLQNSKLKSLKMCGEAQVTYQRRSYEAIRTDIGPINNSDDCEKEIHKQQIIARRSQIDIANDHESDITLDGNVKPVPTTFNLHVTFSRWYMHLQNQSVRSKVRNYCMLCKLTDEDYCGCKILKFNNVKRYTYNFPDGNPPSKPPSKPPPQISPNQLKRLKHTKIPTVDLPVRPQKHTVRCGKAKLQRYSTMKDYSDYRGMPPKSNHDATKRQPTSITRKVDIPKNCLSGPMGGIAIKNVVSGTVNHGKQCAASTINSINNNGKGEKTTYGVQSSNDLYNIDNCRNSNSDGDDDEQDDNNDDNNGDRNGDNDNDNDNSNGDGGFSGSDSGDNNDDNDDDDHDDDNDDDDDDDHNYDNHDNDHDPDHDDNDDDDDDDHNYDNHDNDHDPDHDDNDDDDHGDNDDHDDDDDDHDYNNRDDDHDHDHDDNDNDDHDGDHDDHDHDHDNDDNDHDHDDDNDHDDVNNHLTNNDTRVINAGRMNYFHYFSAEFSSVQPTNYNPQTEDYNYISSSNPVIVDTIQESIPQPENDDPITVEAVQESLAEPETEVSN